MHVVISADESESFLLEELRRAWPSTIPLALGPKLFSIDAPLSAQPLCLVFARQFMPDASELAAPSISAWSEQLVTKVVGCLSSEQPWTLHVEPHYGTGTAGENRCRLIRENVRERLQRKCRRLLRTWRMDPEPFTSEHSLLQLLLVSPECGWLSFAPAPMPYQRRTLISPFPKGEAAIAVDKAAPSRAFAKLLEAELRLGRRIVPGETCVDLGASPGSWTYVALHRKARVIAVDRAPLRDDLMKHPALQFHRGDAFRFFPDQTVDWLLCDVIAAPERSIALILDWARHRRTRHFVVTIKFKGRESYALLEKLKAELPPFCAEFHLTRLCANKNEACAFGSLKA